MKNEKFCSQLNTCFERHMAFKLVCLEKKLDNFFKSALLRSKTSQISESSVDECMYSLFIVFK
jgi:hypothetical protein